jgi:hypothetical protein
MDKKQTNIIIIVTLLLLLHIKIYKILVLFILGLCRVLPTIMSHIMFGSYRNIDIKLYKSTLTQHF